MRIHPEGYRILFVSALVLAAIARALSIPFPESLRWIPYLAALVPYALIINFFRNPIRTIPRKGEDLIYAPADGQVVVIEETFEPEYLKEKRIQVSIFMSIFDVHANRIPVSGKINYYRYHKGRYLVARHPKSSTENERTTLVIENSKGKILMRQIAGYVARRIKFYLNEDQQVEQGAEMGFIRFGSRVDLFLPLDAELNVEVGDKVKGNLDLIARL
ncbi:MAG: phosphatidylserine decarboxylase family protein [Bacteroidetes bacterium]|nr:phosphatidylserine decarboxylase family protein [Bacteroidota bacterium]